MPREAARIFLKITDVSVERIHHISFEHILKEGIKQDSERANRDDYVYAFIDLWNSINSKRNNGIYAWEHNPWVWVYTFERCEKPEAERSEMNESNVGI